MSILTFFGEWATGKARVSRSFVIRIYCKKENYDAFLKESEIERLELMINASEIDFSTMDQDSKGQLGETGRLYKVKVPGGDHHDAVYTITAHASWDAKNYEFKDGVVSYTLICNGLTDKVLENGHYSFVCSRKGDSFYVPVLLNEKISAIATMWSDLKARFEKKVAVAGSSNYPDIRFNTTSVFQIAEPPEGFNSPMQTLHFKLTPPLRYYIDNHMHIQSNSCAPLPLVWDKVGGMHLPWWSLDAVASLVMGDSGRIGKMNTYQIGCDAVAELDASAIKGGLSAAQYEKLWWFIDKRVGTYPRDFSNYWSQTTLHKMISTLPMDMDYAHYKGFRGEQIYRVEYEKDGKTIDKIFYYENSKQEKREKLGWMQNKKYESWDTQVKSHHDVAIKNPWKVMLYYHYEPRRWDFDRFWKNGEPQGKNPFCLLKGGTHPYVGIKTYTPLGYRPWELKLVYQKEFYAYLEREQLPLVNHCTPGGMSTHDKEFYYDFLKEDGALGTEPDKEIEECIIEHKKLLAEFKKVISYSGRENSALYLSKELGVKRSADKLKRLKLKWFEDAFVQPQAWKPVIARYPKLKLCLAHFTGNANHAQNEKTDMITQKTGYRFGFFVKEDGTTIDREKSNEWIVAMMDLIDESNHVYSDISFFVFDEENVKCFNKLLTWARECKPILLDRLIWGTDWPLLETDPFNGIKKPQFNSFAQNSYRHLNQVDMSLWYRLTVINPSRLLDMERVKSILKNCYKGLENGDEEKFIMPTALKKAPQTLDELFEEVK